jgi:hypothetical protein
VDGDAVLDISCLGRIFLDGYVPRWQTSGSVAGFLRSRRDKWSGRERRG